MSERKDQKNSKKLQVSSVEEEILDALAEFTEALEKGEVRQRLTCRQIKLNLIPTQYSPGLVKRTRKKLALSQYLFAKFIGVSPKTVRSWEQGVNTPHPLACRIMDEIRLHTEYWINRLREVTVSK